MDENGTSGPASRAVFARRLRSLRERAGLSQSATAERAGLNRSFYAGVEAGRHSISVDRLQPLAHVLGVAVHQLFTDD
ncbi:helix-turn-helix domain-containing protein [Streptomyces sp. UNOB3_S3]|uniref:helix-turn-helix domain-containing protein n=1 Tax=Streptomyces sp. UNOB3_S3 TaxID=2871682 RepID=UPI001E35008D|nr:helix-turn-helix transcriptional regulator [Streptomyces sp. UNOB3_S3]MCC3773617.1 helix-turn-helix domain-containing protein [Streptomyces sp. UNOB3_S3]